MTERSKLIWVYLFSALFIAFNTYLVLNDFLWGALLPVALIILILYFISLDKIILLITFCTPLAINMENMDIGIGISIPTEPLMIGVLIFFFIKLLHEGKYEIKILKEPLSIAILINLIWLLLASITSEMPVVSFKFLFSRLWFLIPFYFFAVLVFRKYANIKTFIWLYIIPFTGVILYTIYHHALRGFDQESGHWVMRPFYNDHTAYGAALALFIPILFGFSINKKVSQRARIVSAVFFAFFMLALVLSFSRAAWISLAVSLGVYMIVLLKIKFKWVLLSVIVVFSLFFTFQQQILDTLERNEQDSSSNFVEHIQSISNITSDASNLERVNRWQSALRMFWERPFWGWGPGTYQFLYAPYQMSKEKTIISTNAGDLGNAHSEYIGPLAESGIFGMLSILAIFIISVYLGLNVYHKADDSEVKIISLGLTLGLISYYIHGFLNNFLNSDKASVPVWGFMAVLVALKIYHLHRDQKLPEVVKEDIVK